MRQQRAPIRWCSNESPSYSQTQTHTTYFQLKMQGLYYIYANSQIKSIEREYRVVCESKCAVDGAHHHHKIQGNFCKGQRSRLSSPLHSKLIHFNKARKLQLYSQREREQQPLLRYLFFLLFAVYSFLVLKHSTIVIVGHIGRQCTTMNDDTDYFGYFGYCCF